MRRCIASRAASQQVVVPVTAKPDSLPKLSSLQDVILVCVSCLICIIFLPPAPIIIPMHFCGTGTKIFTYPDIVRCIRAEYPRANTETKPSKYSKGKSVTRNGAELGLSSFDYY